MSENRTPFPTANHGFKDPEEIPRFIKESHLAVKAKWMKIDQAMRMTRTLREELDSLLHLGDMVDSEDVIKSAAKLVGAGINAHRMASFLSDMPQADGEPIHLWLQAHDQMLTQREQALKPMHNMARHELGLSALRVLTAGHLEGQIQSQHLPMESPQMLMTEQAPNPLMGMTPQGNA